jgi:hypothetical protein
MMSDIPATAGTMRYTMPAAYSAAAYSSGALGNFGGPYSLGFNNMLGFNSGS